MQVGFNGFPEDAVFFFEDLSRNNEKQWFEENRKRYESSVLEPSKNFVLAMGDRLKEIAPDIVAVPQVNRSLFRLNRDTRFSQDKTPYKTHMGIFLWQGSKKRMENPGYYFQLEPGKILIGVGLYMFPREIMGSYRKAVIDDDLGPDLQIIVDKVERLGYKIGEKRYKRVPKDLPKDHPRAELLKFGGLVAMEEEPVQEWVFEGRIVEELFRMFKEMSPIQEWLLKALD